MSGAQSFVITNRSQEPLLVSAINVPPIMLFFNTSSGNLSAAGNYVVTVMSTGGIVFTVNFSSGPGGPLDIVPGPNPAAAEVDVNYT